METTWVRDADGTSDGARLVPILLTRQAFPKLAAEGILGAVALAVFALSKYMERRKNPN